MIAHKIDPRISKLRSDIQNLMWQYVGIVRVPRQLTQTLKKLESFSPHIEKILSRGIGREALELRNIHTVALLITRAALARKESLGAHYIQN